MSSRIRPMMSRSSSMRTSSSSSPWWDSITISKKDGSISLGIDRQNFLTTRRHPKSRVCCVRSPGRKFWWSIPWDRSLIPRYRSPEFLGSGPPRTQLTGLSGQLVWPYSVGPQAKNSGDRSQEIDLWSLGIDHQNFWAPARQGHSTHDSPDDSSGRKILVIDSRDRFVIVSKSTISSDPCSRIHETENTQSLDRYSTLSIATPYWSVAIWNRDGHYECNRDRSSTTTCI